jgi:hypothetical protein
MDEDKLKETAPGYQTEPFRSEFQSLIDELYREEVLEARKMSPEQKFLAGEELFEYACSITLAGIRSQNPEFSEQDCRRELKRRLELGERLEGRRDGSG